VVVGLVSNIQRYSLHDGPGIRTTVFLKGCPLSCAWCHNPENRAAEPEVLVVESRCVRCGICATACPQGSSANATTAQREAAGCTVCGRCVDACPVEARQLAGREMSVEDVLAEIRKDTAFYDESGGGVTFSGGEPLGQFEFLGSLLEACRRLEIHTAVDTCGFAPRENLLAIAPLVDLFLYDIKLLDNDRHVRFTGVPNLPILENLHALSRVQANLWLRVPVIPGVNDGGEEMLAIARLASSVPGVRQVNLLPYHKTGIAKFQRLGLAYELSDVASPAADTMDALVHQFQSLGLQAKVGG
jgi:pyruvate formate lyase activating enzyme